MERALLIEVKTYGFLHVGVEPLRREVLKRTWSLLAGNTLFGALQAALVRLDGPQGVGPQALISGLAGEPRLRFMPLLPDSDRQVDSAVSYCRQAERLAQAERGDIRVEPGEQPPLRYQTTPHAPLNRRNEQIHGSMLYAVECHQPEQVYRGWIFCGADLKPHIERGIAMLPFLPLGGKGKFTCAEAHIEDECDTSIIREDMAASIRLNNSDLASDGQGRGTHSDIEIELATPLVFEGSDMGIVKEAVRWQPKPPRRYRVWRTGVYPDSTSAGGTRVYGELAAGADLPLAWDPQGTYYVGQTSHAVPALPNGSRFAFAHEQATALANAFIDGVGRADWRALGWGQIFIRTPEEKRGESSDG